MSMEQKWWADRAQRCEVKRYESYSITHLKRSREPEGGFEGVCVYVCRAGTW